MMSGLPHFPPSRLALAAMEYVAGAGPEGLDREAFLLIRGAQEALDCGLIGTDPACPGRLITTAYGRLVAAALP